MAKQIGIYILSLLFIVFINGNSFNTLIKKVCHYHIAFSSDISIDEDRTADEDRSLEDDGNDYCDVKLFAGVYGFTAYLSDSPVGNAGDNGFRLYDYHKVVYSPPDLA